MAMSRPTRSRSNSRLKVAHSCYFCDKKITPNYKDITNIGKFLSERAKILSHAKTGICSKHQKDLSKAIKYARQVALLPFIVRV
jgi:small subunit ribosomal protein S18